MAQLVNFEGSEDPWLSEFAALERLAQQISVQITERDKQNSVAGDK
jgi:hypothetical protein